MLKAVDTVRCHILWDQRHPYVSSGYQRNTDTIEKMTPGFSMWNYQQLPIVYRKTASSSDIIFIRQIYYTFSQRVVFQAFSRALCRSSFASFSKKLCHTLANHLAWLQQHIIYSLIPPDRRSNRAQMPQCVGIDHSPPRREVEQLQTHRQNNPRNDQTRPRCPQTSDLPVSHNTESSPQDILHNADRHVRCHIVGIVEAHE